MWVVHEEVQAFTDARQSRDDELPQRVLLAQAELVVIRRDSIHVVTP